MNTIGRLVTRPANDEKTQTDIFVGVLSKSQTFLKPDTVYEIQEILGQLIIKEVGPSILPMDMQDKTPNKVHSYGYMWCNKIGDIMESAGKHMVLTIKEYKSFKRNKKC